ncbi:hypothetical protein HPP92_020781 [Vanilla planifolia]|uniref:C3H1-type domain-containing protein n=1 Tax=Vanilla planifolia TaxID=51239 RepID=A0A835PZS8_VANPL|nr:hypothetical protein HPP92_020781 [Vanilla planifolia]
MVEAKNARVWYSIVGVMKPYSWPILNASSLKGIECEYRHSEGARINPRDCRFWLSGNCLNPRCIFRHPPLDGLFGNPGVTSVPVVTSSQMTPSVQASKIAASSTSQLETSKKNALAIRECSNQEIPYPSPSSNDVPSFAKDDTSIVDSVNYLPHKSSSRNLLSKSQPKSIPQLQNPPVQPSRHYLHGEAGIILEEPSEIGYSELTRAQDQLPESSGDPFQNGKGAEDVLRESSPGFDVLVDNAIMDADYLHEPDDFSNGFIPDERNMHFEEDYDPLHSGYESSSRLEMDGHNRPVDYQYYRKLQHRGDGDRHWTPSASERILDELEFSERRSSLRLRSPVEMDASDLRHRLMKQRRLNGSSSTKSDGHSYQNRYHTHNSYGDTRRLPESTISNRLRGRIKLPKPFSRESHVKLFSVVSSGFQGRLGGRLGGRAAENSHYNSRKMGRKEKAGDAVNPLDFAGPRSLAELRGARADATKNIDSISSLEPESMKSLKEAELPGYDVSVSFEGPKPLSVLKRKRDAGPQNGAILVASNNRKEENEVKLHSRRDASKGNFENYDRIRVDQPKVETCAKRGSFESCRW